MSYEAIRFGIADPGRRSHVPPPLSARGCPACRGG